MQAQEGEANRRGQHAGYDDQQHVDNHLVGRLYVFMLSVKRDLAQCQKRPNTQEQIPIRHEPSLHVCVIITL